MICAGSTITVPTMALDPIMMSCCVTATPQFQGDVDTTREGHSEIARDVASCHVDGGTAVSGELAT